MQLFSIFCFPVFKPSVWHMLNVLKTFYSAVPVFRVVQIYCNQLGKSRYSVGFSFCCSFSCFIGSEYFTSMIISNYPKRGPILWVYFEKNVKKNVSTVTPCSWLVLMLKVSLTRRHNSGWRVSIRLGCLSFLRCTQRAGTHFYRALPAGFKTMTFTMNDECAKHFAAHVPYVTLSWLAHLLWAKKKKGGGYWH